jgi:cell division protease FtsH
MSDALMKYETIDKYQIDDLMNRKPVREPKGWDETPPPPSTPVEAEPWGQDTHSASVDGTAEQS